MFKILPALLHSFLSTLLTAVLTHHLAWVATVMPTGITPKRAYLDKHASTTVCLYSNVFNFCISLPFFTEMLEEELDKGADKGAEQQTIG